MPEREKATRSTVVSPEPTTCFTTPAPRTSWRTASPVLYPQSASARFVCAAARLDPAPAKLFRDVIGRVKAYEKIVKGENIPAPGVPESFKVLMKELQSIGLDVRILNEDGEEVVLKELDDEDLEQGFGGDHFHGKDGDKAARDKELKEVMEGEDSTTVSRNDVEAAHRGDAAADADESAVDVTDDANDADDPTVDFTITDDPNAGSDE